MDDTTNMDFPIFLPFPMPSGDSSLSSADIPRWVVALVLIGCAVGGTMGWNLSHRSDDIVDHVVPMLFMSVLGAGVGFVFALLLIGIAYVLEPLLKHWRVVASAIALAGLACYGWHKKVEHDRAVALHEAQLFEKANLDAVLAARARHEIDSILLPAWPSPGALQAWPQTRPCPEGFFAGAVRGPYYACYPNWIAQ